MKSKKELNLSCTDFGRWGTWQRVRLSWLHIRRVELLSVNNLFNPNRPYHPTEADNSAVLTARPTKTKHNSFIFLLFYFSTLRERERRRREKRIRTSKDSLLFFSQIAAGLSMLTLFTF